MKKIFIVTMLFLLLAAPARAIDATRSGNKAERLETRRLEFKEKLATIKDTKKKQILEHISNQINGLNSRATDSMLKHLERLQQIINRVKARKPETDITAAQTKIDIAKLAVTAQTENEYILEFTQEKGIKAGASTAKTKFRADIKNVKQKVMAARQAVVDVLKAAKI